MKRILLALTAFAALGTSQASLAQGREYLTPEAKSLITQLETNKRAVILDTLALNSEQLTVFTPIFDEYQAELNTLYTGAANLRNQLWVNDYVGMTDEASTKVLEQAIKLRQDRLDLIEKYAKKLDKKLPGVKVFQWVQVENKVQVLLDLAGAASVPIVTSTPNKMN
jgi:prolyl oligopeptidase PreP (S9A serine peptidase family)